MPFLDSIVVLKRFFHEKGGLEKSSRYIVDAFSSLARRVDLLVDGSDSSIFSHPNVHKNPLRVIHGSNLLKVWHYDKLAQSWLKKQDDSLPVLGLDQNSYQTHLRLGHGLYAHWLTQTKRSWWKLRQKQWLRLEQAALLHPRLTKIFVNSHMVAQEVAAHYPTVAHKVALLRNGVEWDELAPPFYASLDIEQKRKMQRLLGLHPDKLHYLFVGHNFRRKGLKPLLDGFFLFLKKHPYAQLSIIGEDRAATDFRQMANRYGHGEAIRFFGSLDALAVRRFYQAIDYLVIPSYYDPCANVSLEALAMGLFVISSKKNGGAELLNANSGTIIEALDDPFSVEAALFTSLDHPKTAFAALQRRLSVQSLNHKLTKNHLKAIWY